MSSIKSERMSEYSSKDLWIRGQLGIIEERQARRESDPTAPPHVQSEAELYARAMVQVLKADPRRKLTLSQAADLYPQATKIVQAVSDCLMKIQPVSPPSYRGRQNA